DDGVELRGDEPELGIGMPLAEAPRKLLARKLHGLHAGHDARGVARRLRHGSLSSLRCDNSAAGSVLAREQASHRGFAALEPRAAALLTVCRARAVLHDLAGRECRDDLRMDVVTLADRERIAEYRGRAARGLIDDARRL